MTAKKAGNILTGPVALFRGEVGADAAAITTEIGYTEDGLQLSYNDTITNLEVDEEIFPVGATRTAVDMKLSFQIAEATLEHFLFAYGLAADAYDSAAKTLEIDPTAEINYVSIKATGQAPSGGTRTFVFPKVAAGGQRQSAIRKGQKILIPVELTVYKGDDAPGVITDTDAPTAP